MIEITITEDHLKLLKRMSVGWQDAEYGAPEIDPKRPYGNSDVLEDLKEILDEGKEHKTIRCPNCDEDFKVFANQKPDSWYEEIHKQMKFVLEVILQTGQISTGNYIRKNEYDSEWSKVE